MNVQDLRVGSRVQHNYTSGHGLGSVVEIKDFRLAPLAYCVQWDSGAGTFPYTHNTEIQEIVLATTEGVKK